MTTNNQTVTKNELSEALFDQVGLNKREAKDMVESFFEEIRIALERGEVDGRGSNSWASWKSTKAEWLHENKINILVQAALRKDPDLADVPLVLDLAKTPEDRALLEILVAPQVFARPFAAPPGIPDDRARALRDAFDKTVRDPAFIEDAKKVEMLVRPLPWQQAKTMAEELVTMPPDLIAKAKAAMDMK